MKTKVYEVTLKHKCQDKKIYMVDAPSKRIAKWCGANLFNNEYFAFVSAKDMTAKRFKLKGGAE
jgi:hypothetical protein